MAQLSDIASVVRSKNTSPFTLALDIIFTSRQHYDCFKRDNTINSQLIARLYNVAPERILDILYFDPAMAIKVCLLRDIPSGSPGDRDVYGAQQHGPLLEWRFDMPAE
tara:strand:+ start:101093 stop:101416 length:324 start_codon:yes stop_codon:yes gene_type:complete